MSVAPVAATTRDRSKSTGEVVWAVANLLLLLIVFAWDRGVLAVSLPEIKGELDLSPHEVGLIATIFTAGVALVAVPAGILLGRTGFRRALVGSAVVFSAATFYSPLANGFGDLLLSRVFVGLGEGVFHVTLLIYLASLTERHRAALIGLAATVYGLGASTGPSAITFFNAMVHDWRASYYVLGCAGIFLCLPLYIALGGAAVVPPGRAKTDHRSEPDWVRLWKYWPLLLLVGAQGLALYSIVGLLPAWTRANFGFSPEQAAAALGAAGVGMMVGGAPMGLIADRLPRGIYLASAAFVSGISAIALMTLDVGPIIAAVVAFVFGLAAQTLYVTAIAQAQACAQYGSPPLVGLIVTIFYGAASVSGLVLIKMGEWFGSEAGAILTYVILYGCGIIGLAIFEHRRNEFVVSNENGWS